jgi:hypothetical protein
MPSNAYSKVPVAGSQSPRALASTSRNAASERNHLPEEGRKSDPRDLTFELRFPRLNHFLVSEEERARAIFCILLRANLCPATGEKDSDRYQGAMDFRNGREQRYTKVLRWAVKWPRQVSLCWLRALSWIERVPLCIPSIVRTKDIAFYVINKMLRPRRSSSSDGGSTSSSSQC